MYSMLSRMFMMLYYIRKNKPILLLMKSIIELIALSISYVISYE